MVLRISATFSDGKFAPYSALDGEPEKSKIRKTTGAPLERPCRCKVSLRVVTTGYPELLVAVSATELVDLAGSIHDLLLARVKWVAVGTNFDGQVSAVCGAGLERVTTTAGDRNLAVTRVYIRFHDGLSIVLEFARR